MMCTLIDRADLEFQLFDVLRISDYCPAHFRDYDNENIRAVLDCAERLATTKFWPHAAKSDASEPRFVDGRVELIPEIAEALAAYREAGFFGAGFAHELGGMQMPELLRSAVAFVFSASNIGTCGYPLLTTAAANLITQFGSAEQRQRYLIPMVAGRYFGTMCLSEPHAGSSLADITTTATPSGEACFSVTGRKMWISGGDHDLAENIIHLVLARTPGAPAGIKGISLFIVPKFMVNVDGSLGERNGVTLLGLNHKMGYRGTTNAALAFGDNVPCTGFLVGNVGCGLQYMFQMMNEARIAVGLGATAIAAAGYQQSLAYARERRQGRHPHAKDPSTSPVRIIEHADVRRLLLAQKSATEGALALLLYAAHLMDRKKLSHSEAEQQDLNSLLELLTPISKSWPSEFCLESNKQAIQVLGGAGYTRDYAVERLYRDNRLNPIHEGTHGIHGLDILGRKVAAQGGHALSLWSRAVRSDIERSRPFAALEEFRAALEQHVAETVTLTDLLRREIHTSPRIALANATLYLDMIGHVSIAWMWLRQATVAQQLLTEGAPNVVHLTGKYWACRYFYRYALPAARCWRQLIGSLDDTTTDVPPESF